MFYEHRFDPSSPFAALRATLDGDDVMIVLAPRAGAETSRHLPLTPEHLFRQSIARHLLAKLAGVDGEVIEGCVDGIVGEFSNLLPER